MRWASAITEAPTLDGVVDELSAGLLAELAGDTAHLLVLFVGLHWHEKARALARALRARFPEARLVGCSGDGVAADGQERESDRPRSVAAVAAHLPDVWVQPFHASTAAAHARIASPPLWCEALDLIPEQQPIFVLLPDPFSVPADTLIRSMDAAFPGCTKVGGLASGGAAPGDHVLLVDARSYRGGMVGLALTGAIQGRCVVAQGARPAGPTWTVTAADGHEIREVDGEPVIARFEKALAGMSRHERALFRSSALLGVVPPEASGGTGARRVLVRPIVGLSRARGVLAAGMEVPEGATVQLHVRDRAGAVAELDELMAREARAATQLGPPAGALVFSCMGRGAGLFGAPNHDAEALRGPFSRLPMAGFFCDGELGPIHGRGWLHSFTCVALFLRPVAWS